MLEMCINQGAGLHRMAAQAAPRVMALASHGTRQDELALLWSLCATLEGFGYPVAVLDATATESADNPGLAQLLADAAWRADEREAPLAWSVIPAALGVEQLCARPAGGDLPLVTLGGLFDNFGVLLIYARADLLARLLPGSGIAPLLTVSELKTSALSAYQALKLLLLNARLRPTIAAWSSEPGLGTALAGRSPINNLQECAMTFLDYRPDSLAVRAPLPGQDSSDDMHRLALRLMENAPPLPRYAIEGRH